MTKNEMWAMVKKYKAIPQKALESYITYRRSGGKRVNKMYEEFYQKVYRQKNFS